MEAYQPWHASSGVDGGGGVVAVASEVSHEDSDASSLGGECSEDGSRKAVESVVLPCNGEEVEPGIH